MTIAPRAAHFPSVPRDRRRGRVIICADAASSSPAPAASWARCSCRRLARDGPHRARARPRPRRALRAALELTMAMATPPTSSSRSATRSPAPGCASALEGVEVAYYLIHSMETAPAGGTPGSRARARGGGELRPRRRRAGVRRIVYLGGLVPQWRPERHRTGAVSARHLPPSGQPRAGRAGAARGGPGLGGAARLDRDRRALALVPAARPAGGAHARADTAGVARQAPSRSTSAT